MIIITGLTKEKYIELVQIANERMYRYSCSSIEYNEETGGYDIGFSPEISAYITTSYDNSLSTIHLLAIGQHFITLKSTDYTRLSIV